MEQLTGGSHVDLLETANLSYAGEVWQKAFDQINQEISVAQPENIFLSMHLTFHTPGRAPRPYLLQHLQAFEATDVITLIDDIYEVQARVVLNNKIRNTDYHISLRELVWWRTEEIGSAQWLAANLAPRPYTRGLTPQPVRHFVVAVKHPTEMLYKLLFRRDLARIYMSLPITAPRGSEEGRNEIDEIRRQVDSLHIMFDPLTIDELAPPLFQAAHGAAPVIVDSNNPAHRWPIPETGTLGAGRSNVYPVSLDPREVAEVEEFVAHSIRMRDFGLIDPCHYLVGYRPNYRGNFSKGMYAEFNHGFNVCRPPVPIHHYSPSEDSGSGNPFEHFRTRHTDLEGWWSAMRNLRPPSNR